ncbi:MAG TPA: hypothetical protein IAB49_00865 [Candidatus Caccenecus avistercoris]|nr:hypothetical protein [Candidatus Caccenecus avistercoris]
MINQEKTLVNSKKTRHETETLKINSLEETTSEKEYASGREIMKQLRAIYNSITTEELALNEWVKDYLFLKRVHPIMTPEMTLAFANLLKNAKVKVLNLGQEDIYNAFLNKLDETFGLTAREELSR